MWQTKNRPMCIRFLIFHGLHSCGIEYRTTLGIVPRTTLSYRSLSSILFLLIGSTKVCEPCVVILLKWTPIMEWYMAGGCNHPKDMCHNGIGLYFQNIDTIPSSKGNTLGKDNSCDCLKREIIFTRPFITFVSTLEIDKLCDLQLLTKLDEMNFPPIPTFNTLLCTWKCPQH